MEKLEHEFEQVKRIQVIKDYFMKSLIPSMSLAMGMGLLTEEETKEVAEKAVLKSLNTIIENNQINGIYMAVCEAEGIGK